MPEKPVVFISYSHKDEPDHPREGEERWFSYVESHLKPLVQSDQIELWHDRFIEGGANWKPEILKHLAACDVCLLLVSRHSLTSEFILNVEIKNMLTRREKEGAHIYPLLITPTAMSGPGLEWLRQMNIRPRDMNALSGMSPHDRDEAMVKLVGEIAKIAERGAIERSSAEVEQATEAKSSEAPLAPGGIIRTINRYEPKPEIFGRNDAIEKIVEAVLSGKPALIGGGPGMGKTALATAALYDPRVVEKFGDRRVFVSLEGSSEPRALLAGLADALGLPATGDDVTLLRLLETSAADLPVAAVLDNAETVFDTAWSEAEKRLRLAAQVPGLSLVVTIRGVPPSIPGASSISDLERLGDEAAGQAFLSVAGDAFSADDDLPRLLTALDGHPLSIQLVAAQAVGSPSLTGLVEAWEQEHAEILKRPGSEEGKLTSVRASLALSLKTHRMESTPLARRLLALLAFLPGGLAEDDARLLLGDRGAISKARATEAVQCLYQLRLVEGGRLDRRLRMLTPLRESVRLDLPPLPADQHRLVDRFLAVTIKGDAVGTARWSELRDEVEAEVDNLDSVCALAVHVAIGHKHLIDALAGLAELNQFTGKASVASLASPAIQARGTPDLLARCAQSLGDIALGRSDHGEARARFEEALVFYRKIGDVNGEANCIFGLGDIALYRSHNDAARARFEEALALYRKIGSVRGEASCIRSLGDLALGRSNRDEAGARFEEALALYRKIGDVNGEANCIFGLGDIAPYRSDNDAARARFEEALALYRKIGSVLGEASCIRSLGAIARRSDHGEARARFEEALALYKKIGDVHGEANCIRDLGDIALYRSDNDAARARFEEALALFKKIGDIHGEANCMRQPRGHRAPPFRP